MLTLVLAAFLTPDASANDQSFDADFQYRPRYEIRIKDPDSTPILKATHRARATMNWANSNVEGRFSVQDVRTFGEEWNSLKDFSADGFDLHEGYLTWLASDALNLRVGRQEVTMHGHRLIGNVGWTQQGRSLDGARASGSFGSISYDLVGAILANGSTPSWAVSSTEITTTTTTSGGSQNQNTVIVETDAVSSSLQILRLGWKSDIALMDTLLVRDENSALDQNRFTAGLYSKMKAGIFSGRLEGYVQVDGESTANMVGVYSTVAPNVGTKPTLTIWYDRLSSVSDEGDSGFNTLFATNHKFYGNADIMAFSQGAMADGRGLQDISIKASIKPADGHTVKVDLHLFSATDGLDEAAYGNEVDLMAVSKLTDALTLGWGGSYFMHASDESPADIWGWLQLDASL